MELKYGDSKTYKHELDKERMSWLTTRTNRSTSQTQFLFQLVDGDFELLKKLEMNLVNCFCAYAPGDKESVQQVLNFVPKKQWFTL